ncbi:hypothetical protein NKH18_21455 [Streptomyces sp. M10(2022)]
MFGNVGDPREVADEHFTPSDKANVRFVVDYPWDDEDRFPSYDYQRVMGLKKNGLSAATLVWLPDFFSEQRKAQLGQLMRINFLLERNRLDEYTRTYAPDDRVKARRQLEIGRDTLTDTLVASLGEVYGISAPREGTKAVEVVDGRHVLSLLPQLPRPELEGGKRFADNVAHLADGMFGALHPSTRTSAPTATVSARRSPRPSCGPPWSGSPGPWTTEGALRSTGTTWRPSNASSNRWSSARSTTGRSSCAPTGGPASTRPPPRTRSATTSPSRTSAAGSPRNPSATPVSTSRPPTC